MPTYGEQYDVKVYRNGVLVFDDSPNEVISFELERPVTTERAEARLRFDAGTIPPDAIQENDALVVYISTGSTIPTKVFAGEVVEVNKVREEGEPFIDVVVHDWSKLLSEKKVNLSYPVVTNASTIVKQIVSSITTSGTPGPNERKISVNGVETVNKTRTIDFIGLSMYEALAKLSDYTLCDFYVDEDKDLNWFIRGSRSASKTLTASDLQNYEYITNREVCNQAKVFGAPNRTDPEFDLDAYSESLTDWDSYATGGGGTISVEKVPGLYNTLTYGWTHNTAYSEQTQYMKANAFVNQSKEWQSSGTSPWLYDADESTNIIFAHVADPDGEKMEYWDFENTNTVFSSVKEWKQMELQLQVKFLVSIDTFWNCPCESASDFTSIQGSYGFPPEGVSGNCFKPTYAASNGAIGYKVLTYGTANARMYFYVKLPAATNYPDGDEIVMPGYRFFNKWKLYLYIKSAGGVSWYYGIKGWDKNDAGWSVNTGWSPASGIWHWLSLTALNVGTSSTTYILRDEDSDVEITRKEGVDTTGEYITKFAVAGIFPYRPAADQNIRYDEVIGQCTCRKTGAKPKLYKTTDGDYLDLGTFDLYDYETSLTWKTIDIKNYFNYPTDQVINNLNGLRLWLQTVSYLNTGETGSGGGIIITAARVYIKADCYYGEGNPWIGDDDGDQDYIQVTSPDLAEDRSYTNFNFLLAGFASLVQVEIDVKARNVGGAADAVIKPMVKDAESSAWIDLDSLTWDTSETSYSTKTVDATVALSGGNVRYKIEHLEIGFKKIGATGTIRITYAKVKVKYLQAASLLTLDATVKKAGDYSIKLFWGGTEGQGTIDTYLWRDFTAPIACQTTTCKEGFTELVFAALIAMSVWSELDHWKRPQAKLEDFTVFLYDTSGNKIKYSAGDLYPVSSFTATPGPAETKLKEIHVPIGSDAEADGKWEMVTGSTFDWTEVVTVEFYVKGMTDTEVEGNPYLEYIILWIDWLHLEAGKWYAEYALDESSYSVTTYGRSYNEVFDKTCFSYEDCYMKAKYYVEVHKYPTDSLENVEVDYQGMEALNPGEVVSFELPEGTLSLRISMIKWVWDGDIYGELTLDNEGIKPSPVSCPSGEQILDGGFEDWIDGCWPHLQYWNYESAYQDYDCHSGTWAVALYDTFSPAYVSQTLTTPIKVSCIQSFTVWMKAHETCAWGKGRIRITYTDTSTTEIIVNPGDGSWHQVNILASLDADKTVSAVRLEVYQVEWVTWDDCSLIGTGV